MASSFYQTIYQLTAKIPAGAVATYGQLAFLAGSPRASRIVGGAMARAPEGLPCHRVIYGDGRLSPPDVFGGPGVQRVTEDEGAHIGDHMFIMRADARPAARQRVLSQRQPEGRIQPGRLVDKEIFVAFRRPEGDPFRKEVAFAALVEGGAGAQGAVSVLPADVKTGPLAGQQQGGKRVAAGPAGRGRRQPRRGTVHR